MPKAEQKNKSWSEAEDILLKDCVLENVRNGKTQLIAFEEVAEQTGRSAGSVGFRWNSTLRQQYSDDLKKAKEEAKNKNSKTKKVKTTPSSIQGSTKKNKSAIAPTPSLTTIDDPFKEDGGITYEDVISFLRNKKKADDEYSQLKDEHTALQEEYNSLKEDFEEVRRLVSRSDNT
ncbi:hypothetical protein O0Q50_18890 [Priestia aryabhattai]|uniref:Myb-like domain-containing protein n=1 Tax=Priestia aryabhattai TaxID=412384 RepID=A0AAX6NBY7_PRIAR|nr:hypothetical protein [Priestia aryabhattai]MDU9693246.1 hypothetical protein [Priestia aryabhattai]